MLFIVAGLLAAMIVWWMNYLLLRLVPEKAIYIAPVLEETVKTAAALLFGTSILLTHLVFGVTEAVWDIYNSRKLGPAAAWLSVGGHAGFGLLAEQIFMWRSNFLYAVGGAVLLHLGWNFTIGQLIKSVRTKG